jgi:hypothetical protein
VLDEDLGGTGCLARNDLQKSGVIERGKEVGWIRISEDNEFVRELVSDDGAHRHLEPVQRLQCEQPQAAIELVQVQDVIECCAWLEVICPGDAERKKIRAQPVVPDSLEPFKRAIAIIAGQLSADQEFQLPSIGESCLGVFHPKTKNPPI